jgi:hypothetical protein
MKDRGKRAVQAKSGCAFPLSRGIGLPGIPLVFALC